MDLSTLREKKSRWVRLAFTRFVIDRYGLNFQTAHGKIRRVLMRKWELVGIENCIHAFDPDYLGEAKDFIFTTDSKMKFYRFMEKEYEMSAKTAFTRFQTFKFSELELKGFNAVYDEFVESQKAAV